MTEQQHTCTICQDDIEHDAQATLEDSCSHVFHSECIKQWALTFLDKKREKKGSPKCPICRSPFTTIVAFDKSKFVLDVEEEGEEEDEWEDFIDDDEEDEEEEDDGSDYDDDNAPRSGDGFNRCVSCLAQVVEHTPNVFRCTAFHCTAAIHHHCLGSSDNGAGSWRCPQCLARASRAATLASRRQAQAANAQRRRAQQAQQQLARRQQRSRQQLQLRGQRAAFRSSSSTSSSSSFTSSSQPSSVCKLSESLSKAKSATARSETATYYIRSERDLVESFKQARVAAEIAATRLAKGKPPARKRKLTGIALEAQQALAGGMSSAAPLPTHPLPPSSSSSLKRRYDKKAAAPPRQDDYDYDEEW